MSDIEEINNNIEEQQVDMPEADLPDKSNEECIKDFELSNADLPVDEDDDDCMDSADDADIEANIESVIESVLFASDEPLTKAKILKITELSSVKEISEAIKNLNAKYRLNNNAFRIEKIAGGYQMMTLPIFNSWLSKMITVKTDTKLTQAALETLAIVAYKQPIIRADIESVRGVSSGEMVRSLMYKGLVKIVGRAEILGRPLLYGTTKKFLETFGLNSLKDLPSVEELKKPQQ